MSTIIERVCDHLDAENLLAGWLVQRYRWRDSAYDGRPMFVIRRMGGGGSADYLVQNPDIQLILVTASHLDIATGEQRMVDILRYLRGNYKSPGIKYYKPMSNIIGPFELENGRGVFELNIRCMTDDQ